MLLKKAEGHSPESSQRGQVYELTSVLPLDPQSSWTLPPISAKSWPDSVLEFLLPDVGLGTPCSTSKATMQGPRLTHSPNVLSSHHFKGGNDSGICLWSTANFQKSGRGAVIFIFKMLHLSLLCPRLV